MIDFESLPGCPTCGAMFVAAARTVESNDSLMPLTDAVGWACGASAKRTLRMLFDKTTFPNGKFGTYSTGKWSTPTGCRNAEEVVRRMRAEQVDKVPK